MRMLVIALFALAGCASTAPSGARSGIEVVRVAAPQTSEQERLAAYWRERERRPVLIRDREFAPRAAPLSFSNTRESDEQAWRDRIRLEREAAERRKAMREAIQR